MLTAILRRTCSTLSRRAFPAVVISASNDFRPLSAAFIPRNFHSKPVPLNFRYSLYHRAEYAVDEFPYEEGSKGNADEGLEIAKLGISQDIVSALAKKGITKLFPIQVCFAPKGLCDDA